MLLKRAPQPPTQDENGEPVEVSPVTGIGTPYHWTDLADEPVEVCASCAAFIAAHPVEGVELVDGEGVVIEDVAGLPAVTPDADLASIATEPEAPVQPAPVVDLSAVDDGSPSQLPDSATPAPEPTIVIEPMPEPVEVLTRLDAGQDAVTPDNAQED